MNDIDNMTSPGPTATMTSREIAELTGKEHFHVMRDIAAMFDELGLGASSFGSSYLSAQNKPMPMFALPQDLTLTLVTGYSVVMRHRIVTRWKELEMQARNPMAACGQSRDSARRMRTYWRSEVGRPNS